MQTRPIRLCLPVLLFSFALLVVMRTAPARADVIPPQQSACEGKEVGARCEDPEEGVARGTCRASTCSRLDYAHWDRDASSTPPSMSYDCVLCTSGAADAGAPDAGGSSDKGGGGCAVGPSNAGARLAALLFAAAFGVLVSRRRWRS